MAGEVYDVWHRDILECIQTLIGDPEFAQHLKLAPERHYADKDHLNRVFSDVHTGKWWWKIQVCYYLVSSATHPLIIYIIGCIGKEAAWGHSHPSFYLI